MTTISAGQLDEVGANQTAAGVTILGGGTLFVEAGGTVSGTVDSGGTLTIFAGGKSFGAVLSNEGNINVFGSATGIVDNGGDLGASDGGVIVNTIMNEDDAYIGSGGTTIGMVVSAGAANNVISGGTAIGTILNGGTEYVGLGGSGGVTNGTVVNAGGSEYELVNTAVVNNVTVNSGGQVVALGEVNGAVIGKGGLVTAYDGSAITGAIVDNGMLDFHVTSGQLFSGTLTGSGSLLDEGGGKLVIGSALKNNVGIEVGAETSLEFKAAANTNVLLDFQNKLILDDAQEFTGTVSGMGVRDGDTIDLAQFAFNKATTAAFHDNGNGTGTLTISDGVDPSVKLQLAGDFSSAVFQVASDGANGTDVTVVSASTSPSPGMGGGTGNNGGGTTTPSGETLNKGDQLLAVAGSVVSHTTVNSGGFLTVLKGGETDGTVVNKGGVEYLEAGATTSNAIINSGGEEYVNVNATANKITVNAGGDVELFSGGTVNSATIASGGDLEDFGGKLEGAVVNNGLIDADIGVGVAATVDANISGSGSMIVHNGGALKVNTALNNGMAVEVGADSSLELGAASNAHVTLDFQSTLKLDNSLTFSGTVAGTNRDGDSIDLADVAFIKGVTTVKFVENAAHTEGTLTVSDQAAGGPTVHLTLLGNYSASAFSVSADATASTQNPHPGTLIHGPF
jgi:autotransporter passenger strand-loop-strand repeat protein